MAAMRFWEAKERPQYPENCVIDKSWAGQGRAEEVINELAVFQKSPGTGSLADDMGNSHTHTYLS